MVRPIGGDDGLPVTNTAVEKKSKTLWAKYVPKIFNAWTKKDTRGREVTQGQSGQVVITNSRLKIDKETEESIEKSLNSIKVSKDKNSETSSTTNNNKILEESNKKFEYSGEEQISTVSEITSAQVEDAEFYPKNAKELATKVGELASWFGDNVMYFHPAKKIADILQDKIRLGVDFDAHADTDQKQIALTELKKAEKVFVSESWKILEPSSKRIASLSNEIAKRINNAEKKIQKLGGAFANKDEQDAIKIARAEISKGLISEIAKFESLIDEEYANSRVSLKEASEDNTNEDYTSAQSNYVKRRADYIILGLGGMAVEVMSLDENGSGLTKGLGEFLDKMGKVANILSEIRKFPAEEFLDLKLDQAKIKMFKEIEELLEYKKKYDPLMDFLINQQ